MQSNASVGHLSVATDCVVEDSFHAFSLLAGLDAGLLFLLLRVRPPASPSFCLGVIDRLSIQAGTHAFVVLDKFLVSTVRGNEGLVIGDRFLVHGGATSEQQALNRHHAQRK